MKKAWKKLLATMLAGVMALSCVVTAGATEPTPPSDHDGVGAVDPADTGVAVTSDDQKTETKYASGNAKGKSRTEGKLPVDPVRIELPTINQDTLNMILDPYGLINRTGAARYLDPEDDSYTVSFEENTPLYFLNSFTEGEDDGDPDTYAFTNETQTLTVTNKSHVPVGLDVTLRVNKNDSVFKFVDSKDALEAETEGAAMFLALKSGEDIYDVKDLTATAADEDEDEEEEEEEDEETAGFVATPVITVGEDGDLADLIDATATTLNDSTNDTSQYPTASFQWAQGTSNTDKSDFVTALTASGKAITLTYKAAVAADEDEGTPAVPAHFEITAADVSEDYEISIEPAQITNATRDTLVTVTYSAVGEEEEEDEDEEEVAAVAGTPVAYAYFIVQAGAFEFENIDNNQTAVLTVTPGAEITAQAEAKFTTSIAMTPGAYIEGWDSTGGYYWQFTQEATATQKNAWGKEDVVAPTKYESVSFSITGSINKPAAGAKTSVWDGKGSDIALDLIWDVFAVDEGDVPASKTGSKATISSVTPATGTKTSTKYATINFTPGTEDYAEYEVTGVKYGDNTIDADNLTITETSVRVDTTTSGFKTATSFALVFALDGDSYEVAITDALF